MTDDKMSSFLKKVHICIIYALLNTYIYSFFVLRFVKNAEEFEKEDEKSRQDQISFSFIM